MNDTNIGDVALTVGAIGAVVLALLGLIAGLLL